MTPRYEVRWLNGYWRLFDTVQYAPVDMTEYERRPWFKLQTTAVKACEWANAQ